MCDYDRRDEGKTLCHGGSTKRGYIEPSYRTTIIMYCYAPLCSHPNMKLLCLKKLCQHIVPRPSLHYLQTSVPANLCTRDCMHYALQAQECMAMLQAADD